MGNKPTIYDVAEAAGVSITAVSDVLNGHGRIAPETAASIRAVMEELGYRPRANRRRKENLAQNRRAREACGRVTLLIPDPNPAAARTYRMERVARGAAEYLGQSDVDLISAGMDLQGDLPPCVDADRTEGVILRVGELSEKQRRALSKIPCVEFFSVEMDSPGDQVVIDNQAIGAMAARYLLEKGCTELVALNPDDAHPSFDLRARAFCFAGRRQERSTRVEQIERGADLRDVFPSPPGPRERLGLFVAGYNEFNSSEDVERRLKGAAMSRENGVIVVGADARQVSHPKVKVAPERVGRHCAEQLLWRISHPEADRRRILIEPRLTE